jgi:hypothetical protein
MRHRPRPRHLLAGLILASAAALYGYLAILDRQISQTQTHIATAALRGEQHDLFAADAVYGTSELWRLNSPAFLGILELVLVPTGFSDPTLAFRCFVAAFALVHLAGMYALIYRQTKLWSISVYAAILSSAVTYCLGRWFWGIGPVDSITPAAACLATVPLVVLTFLEHEHDWRLILVFLFVGLLGNIHLATSMTLTLVLGGTYLARRWFAPSAWPMAIACILAAVIGSLPYTAYFLTLQARVSQPALDAAAQAQVFHQVIRTAEMRVLYPELLNSLLSWLLEAAILLIPAIAVLLPLSRYPVRNRGFWAWLMGVSLLVALGLQGAAQLLGLWRGRIPLAVTFIEASVLVMFAAHVLLACAATQVLRMVRHHKGLVQVGLGLFAVLWLLPSDNLRIVRRAGYDLATSFLAESNKPMHVQEIHLRNRREAEKLRIARWVRENTPVTAVVLTEDIEFRLHSRRALLASPADARYTYSLGRRRLADWQDKLQTQRSLLFDPSGTPQFDELARWIRDLGRREQYSQVRQWYVLMNLKDLGEPSEHWTFVKPEGWGDFHALLRLTSPTPAPENPQTP